MFDCIMYCYSALYNQLLGDSKTAAMAENPVRYLAPIPEMEEPNQKDPAFRHTGERNDKSKHESVGCVKNRPN